MTTLQIIELIAKIITAIGVFAAVFKLRADLAARLVDLRWRKLTAARDLLSDIHKQSYAVEAVNMIDCFNAALPYDAPATLGGYGRLTKDDFVRAFSTESASDDAEVTQRVFIRRCFDWLMSYLDRITFVVHESQLDPNDVQAPLAPYLEFVAANWDLLSPMSTAQRYIHLATAIQGSRQVPRVSKRLVPAG